jgi:hypothetical protein
MTSPDTHIGHPLDVLPVTGAQKRAAVDEWLDVLEAEAMLADGLDDAIIGVVEQKGGQPLVCYDRGEVIAIHMRQGMDREEATEFVDFNVTDAYVGPGTPCFLTVPWRE